MNKLFTDVLGAIAGLVIGFLIVAASANASVELPHYCNSAESVLESALIRFGETEGDIHRDPRLEDYLYFVTRNPETGTWSAIVVHSNGTACVIEHERTASEPPAAEEVFDRLLALIGSPS